MCYLGQWIPGEFLTVQPYLAFADFKATLDGTGLTHLKMWPKT